jgi:hypothetical protein
MKKISTRAAKQSRNFSEQKLTIGLDLGDRTSYYCVLDEAGAGGERAKSCEQREGSASGIRGDAAQPDGAGNRDAFSVGEPAAGRIGT